MTEVIDPFNAENICQNLSEFPKEVYAAVGGTINGQEIVCGGKDFNTDEYFASCHFVEQNLSKNNYITRCSRQWIFFKKPIMNRKYDL